MNTYRFRRLAHLHYSITAASEEEAVALAATFEEVWDAQDLEVDVDVFTEEHAADEAALYPPQTVPDADDIIDVADDDIDGAPWTEAG